MPTPPVSQAAKATKAKSTALHFPMHTSPCSDPARQAWRHSPVVATTSDAETQTAPESPCRIVAATLTVACTALSIDGISGACC
jgi:hypothetical protein